MLFSLANNETTRVKAADLDIPPSRMYGRYSARLGSAQISKSSSLDLSSCVPSLESKSQLMHLYFSWKLFIIISRKKKSDYLC